MAYAMTKQGSLDNCVTYEFICDAIEDMNAIEDIYRTIGSIAIVLQGTSGLEVYISGSDKQWNSLSSIGGSAADSAAGLSIHICGQNEVSNGLPNISEPDETSIYLVPAANSSSGDLYDEYVYVGNNWEKFGGGGSSIDLSSYAPKTSPVFTGSISLGRASQSTVGEGSVAEGYNATASGNYSHAEGYNTTASDQASHAEGYETTASGNDSHAEGNATTASGNYSHAEGSNVIASGGASHAEGDGELEESKTINNNTYTTGGAYGEASHAEGYGTLALEESSHAEGFGTVASAWASHTEGYDTTASGECSHAEGSETVASEWTSHAEGDGTTASNYCSHAEGSRAVASGNTSHAEGQGATASALDSHAEGYYTVASGSYSHVEGYLTTAAGGSSHVVGRYNVIDSYTLQPAEWQANTHYEVGDKVTRSTNDGTSSILTCTTSNTDQTFNQIHWRDFEEINYVEIVGNGLEETNRSNARTLDWKGNERLMGDLYVGCNADSSGGTKVATVASPVFTDSISLGRKANTTVGNNSFAVGYNVEAGNYAHAEGAMTVASGADSHAEGVYTTASGSNSHAEGFYTIASGGNSHAEGFYTTANHLAQHTSGMWNIADSASTVADGRGNYVEIIGNGTADNTRSNARTLDWDGNERLMGDLYVGCNADSTGGTKLPRIPSAPSTDGTYILQATVTNGIPTYSWISAG